MNRKHIQDRASSFDGNKATNQESQLMRTCVHHCLSLVVGIGILMFAGCLSTAGIESAETAQSPVESAGAAQTAVELAGTAQSPVESASTNIVGGGGPIGDFKLCCIPFTCPTGGPGTLFCTGNGSTSIAQAA